MTKIIIGIDPDVDKSGVATLTLKDNKPQSLNIRSLSFAHLIDYITTLKAKLKDQPDSQLIVSVETNKAGSNNWHLSPRDNRAQIAAKGYHLGRNHETGQKLLEIVRHLGINTIAHPPLIKLWQGRFKKITHQELTQVIPDNLIEKTRTNQEERDATLIAWATAGLPVKVKLQSKARPRRTQRAMTTAIAYTLLLIASTACSLKRTTTAKATAQTQRQEQTSLESSSMAINRLIQLKKDSLTQETETHTQELDTAGRVRTITKIRTITRAGRIDTIYLASEKSETSKSSETSEATENIKTSEFSETKTTTGWILPIIALGLLISIAFIFIILKDLRRL